jgi:nitrous oxide reductase accessory protein NosL
MKLTEILNEVDRGDLELAQTVERRQRTDSQHMDPSRGFWLVDRKSGKKLSGPFKDEDAAARFKQNRSDRIPTDARIVRV